MCRIPNGNNWCLVCLYSNSPDFFLAFAQYLRSIFLALHNICILEAECQPLLHESPSFLLGFFSSPRRTFAGWQFPLLEPLPLPPLFFAVFLLFAKSLVSTPRLCGRAKSLQELFLCFLSKVRIFCAVLRFLVFLGARISKNRCRLRGIFCPAIPTQLCLLAVEASTGRPRLGGAVLVFCSWRVLCERFRLSCSNGAGLAPPLLRLRTGCLPEKLDISGSQSPPPPTKQLFPTFLGLALSLVWGVRGSPKFFLSLCARTSQQRYFLAVCPREPDTDPGFWQGFATVC